MQKKIALPSICRLTASVSPAQRHQNRLRRLTHQSLCPESAFAAKSIRSKGGAKRQRSPLFSLPRETSRPALSRKRTSRANVGILYGSTSLSRLRDPSLSRPNLRSASVLSKSSFG